MRKAGRNHRVSVDPLAVAARRAAAELLEDRRLLSAYGPDAYGYRADPYPTQSVDLVAGAPGVVSVLTDDDDGTTPIKLGSNSFTFYGTTYTGDTALWVSSNGLISVGNSGTDFNNNLNGGVANPVIAPLWDDYVTTHNANDQVLYKIETVNGHTRLVVEWNVYPFNSFGAAGDDITFQAILELNTGGESGSIIFNYLDLQSSVVPHGSSASVGIKSAGTSDPVRLVISHDTALAFAPGFHAFLIEKNQKPTVVQAGPVGDVYEGGVATLSVTASDPDASDLLTYAWDLDNDGSFETLGQSATFDATNLDGPTSATVRVRVSDGMFGHDVVQSVIVDVKNADPDAADDTVAAAEDTPVVFNPLDNDSDAGHDSLTLTVLTQPANGSLSANADGSFTYTPAPNFFGADQFTYELSDGEGGVSRVATVTINVAPMNDAPTAVDDAHVTGEDTATIVYPLANDIDVDGDALSPAVVSGPYHGTLVPNDDGSFRYTPFANFFGTDRFTYEVRDPAGAVSNVATVTITVAEVNDAPVAADDAGTTQEGTALLGNVLPNDSDPDNEDGLAGNDDTLSAELVSGPANGTLELLADGRFTYTPASGFSGTDTFTYRARDSRGLASGDAVVTITVTPASDPEPEPEPVGIQIIADATLPGLTALVIRGTASGEIIAVVPATGGVEVYFGCESQGVFSPTGRIIVYARGGNDAILIAGAVSRPVWAYGDEGNDLIKLGNGGGIAFGGAGSDAIVGGSGRDILVGGENGDLLVGNPGDDILISALTVYDDRSSLASHENTWSTILAEWSSARTFAERVNNLTPFLNDDTISDDLAADSVDILTGSSGTDWILYKAGEDKVAGLSSTEAQYDVAIA